MELEMTSITTSKKLSLIEGTVEEVFVLGMINKLLLRIVFDVNAILLFTTLDQDEDKDKVEWYEDLKYKGVIDQFYAEMPQDLLDELWDYTLDYAKEFIQYQNSFSGFLDRLQYTGTDLIKGLVTELKEVDLDALPEVKKVAERLGVLPAENVS